MILGIIPARGGSKGVPRKNIKLIAGKPLIVWTIEAAKKAMLLDRFVVSTEDAEIAEISKKYGAEVINRPVEMAEDKAVILPVLQHVLKNVDADAAVLLEPTSPIRDEGIIDFCIKRFIATGADNLATGFFCKYTEYGTCTQRRQDIKGFFYNVGAVYVIKAKIIISGKLMGEKIEKIEVGREQSIEIDDDFDFWLAEQVLLKRLKA